MHKQPIAVFGSATLAGADLPILEAFWEGMEILQGTLPHPSEGGPQRPLEFVAVDEVGVVRTIQRLMNGEIDPDLNREMMVLDAPAPGDEHALFSALAEVAAGAIVIHDGEDSHAFQAIHALEDAGVPHVTMLISPESRRHLVQRRFTSVPVPAEQAVQQPKSIGAGYGGWDAWPMAEPGMPGAPDVIDAHNSAYLEAADEAGFDVSGIGISRWLGMEVEELTL